MCINPSATPKTLAQLIFWEEISLPSWVLDMALFQSVWVSPVCLCYSGIILDASIRERQWQFLRKALEEGAS